MRKISVIVPVYNVENYLTRCLKSLIHQTYSNLEIIVVDDGSTDGSSKICDQFAQKYSNIIVIHKENGGSSDARNAGLKKATGEFIGFVDSDDFIEINMYEVLSNMMERYTCDIAIISHLTETEKGDILNRPVSFSKCKIINQIDSIKTLILPDNFSTCVWDKLFKREIISDILFTKGSLSEDLCFFASVLLNAKKIVYNPYPLYHYIQRETSITSTNSVKRVLSELIDLQKRKKLLVSEKAELKDILEIGYCFNLVGTLGTINHNKKKYTRLYDYILREIRRRVFLVLPSKNISINRKIQLIIVFVNPTIMVRLKTVWKSVDNLYKKACMKK